MMTMKAADFDVYLNERLNLIKQVLGSKALEYSSGGDRLHNFNLSVQLAPGLFTTREDAAHSFLTKHLTSYLDILENLRARGEVPSREMLREKFGDIINYFILIEIMLIQRAEAKDGERTQQIYESNDDLPF